MRVTGIKDIVEILIEIVYIPHPLHLNYVQNDL